MSRVAKRLALAALLAALACAARAEPLIARVDPRWSPYLRSSAADPAGTLAEARKLLTTNPARVSEVLAGAKLDLPSWSKAARGLRSDAQYLLGGDALLDAQRGYRAILVDDPAGDEAAWATFMDGNIKKILGFTQEARIAFYGALKWPGVPWRAALLFNAGVLEVEEGRMSHGAAYLEDWLREFRGQPGTALVLGLLAECYSHTGREDESLGLMEESRALDPRAWLARPAIGYRLADEFKRAGRMDEGVDLLEEVAGEVPGTPEAAHARLLAGYLWEELGRIEDAARAYAKLVDERPTPEDEEEARLRLALLGIRYGDEIEINEALPGFRDFYRPQPRLEALFTSADLGRKQRAHYGLAELERKLGSPEKALDLYIEIFDKYPQTPVSGQAYERFMELLESRMNELLTTGQALEALALHEKYRPKAGWTPTRDLGGLDLLAARAYQALGSPKLARGMYETALKSGTRAQGSEAILDDMLRTRMAENDPEAFAAWLGSHPGDRAARLSFARLLRRAGRVDEARAQYDLLLRDEKDAAAKLDLLREADGLTAGTGTLDERLAAVESRRKLLEKDKKAPPALDERLTQARLLFAKGRHADAAKLLEAVPEPTPEDAYLLALCHRALGRVDEARAAFEKLVAEKKDATIAELAATHLEVMKLERREGRAK